MTCIVPFCRKECEIVPEGADINRASGKVLCKCGHPLYAHTEVAYPSGMGHCVVDCSGEYWHL